MNLIDWAIIKSYIFHHSSGTGDYDIYDGKYEIIPNSATQTLPTRNKLLTTDITIEKIPYFETSNTSGTTVYIG